MATTKRAPSAKTAEKQQTKAITAIFNAVFAGVPVPILATTGIFAAAKDAMDRGAAEADVATAMVGAWHGFIPTPTPLIPVDDRQILGAALDDKTVGNADERPLDFARRMGLRVLAHDHLGRVVVHRAGWRVVLSPEGGRIVTATGRRDLDPKPALAAAFGDV